MTERAERRTRFDAVVAELVSRRIESVAYWDMAAFDDQPRRWDYGNWHHAVMGVEFGTDRGPLSLTWTNTFWPYGIEAILKPMSELVSDTCEHWDVSTVPPWDVLCGSQIRAATTHWERFTHEGSWPEGASSFDVPLGIRLDCEGGTAWVIVGIPQAPDMHDVFVPGDEIMVVFAQDRLRQIGFPQEFVD